MTYASTLTKLVIAYASGFQGFLLMRMGEGKRILAYASGFQGFLLMRMRALAGRQWHPRPQEWKATGTS